MKKKAEKPKPGTAEYIKSLVGMFGNGGNASEEFMKERRKDDAMFMQKMERIEQSRKDIDKEQK
jgi:hypothetical protein